MNISITFRHVDASDSIKQYASDKLNKLQKMLHHPIEAKVTISLEKLQHVVEVRLSSGSEHLEAREATTDMYASIDKVVDKLERQISHSKGAMLAGRRGAETVRGS